MTRELAEKADTSALDNPEEDTIEFEDQSPANPSSSSTNSLTSSNNSAVRQLQFPIMALTDIGVFKADFKHFLLREFGLGHEATSPITLFCANRGFVNVGLLEDEEPQLMEGYLDKGYSTATNLDIAFVHVTKLTFYKAHLYLQKRRLIDDDNKTPITSWTAAEFDGFLLNLRSRSIQLKDLEQQIDKSMGNSAGAGIQGNLSSFKKQATSWDQAKRDFSAIKI